MNRDDLESAARAADVKLQSGASVVAAFLAKPHGWIILVLVFGAGFLVAKLL